MHAVTATKLLVAARFFGSWDSWGASHAAYFNVRASCSSGGGDGPGKPSSRFPSVGGQHGLPIAARIQFTMPCTATQQVDDAAVVFGSRPAHKAGVITGPHANLGLT